MPATPLHPCPICRRNLTRDKYCGACKPKMDARQKLVQQQYDRARGTVTERGYGWDWAQIRDYKLAEYPLCERCKRTGRDKQADVVHHVKEVITHHELRLETGNLMSLCRECHEKIHGRKR